jgi:ubiquitin-protein ligase
MIEFNCPNCRKRFKVPDELAGRAAKCKACAALLRVPMATPAQVDAQVRLALPDGVESGSAAVATVAAAATATVAPPAPAPAPARAGGAARIPMRTRRLMADAQHVAEAFKDSPVIRVLEMQGEPPDLYRIEYQIESLEPTENPERPAPRKLHRVEIQLTAEYPRMSPQCKMLTPVYHPNIDPSHICVGDHWAAGERLVDLVVRIGEMLAYQAYNIKSPLDAQAAMWADLNGEKLPTDARTIRPAEME